MTKKIKLKNYKQIDTVFSMMKGLMFEKKVKNTLLFMFPQNVTHAFHSIFCPDFDIIFLNEKKEVIYSEEIRGLKLINPRKKYKYVIETYPGFIIKNKIKNKTKIEF